MAIKISKVWLEGLDMSIYEFLHKKQDDPDWYCNKERDWCLEHGHTVREQIEYDPSDHCYEITYQFVLPDDVTTLFLLKFPLDK